MIIKRFTRMAYLYHIIEGVHSLGNHESCSRRSVHSCRGTTLRTMRNTVTVAAAHTIT